MHTLLIDDGIPPKVALSEAVRLARKFSTAEAGAFVNAVLDALYKKQLGETPDDKALESSAAALAESEDIARQASEEGEEE